MKVQRVFLVACHEEVFSAQTVFLAVYGTTAHGETTFAFCSSDFEESLNDEYPDRVTFERAHNEPEWFDNLDDLSDELEVFPWTRGALWYLLPEYADEIQLLADRTLAGARGAWADIGNK